MYVSKYYKFNYSYNWEMSCLIAMFYRFNHTVFQALADLYNIPPSRYILIKL